MAQMKKTAAKKAAAKPSTVQQVAKRFGITAREIIGNGRFNQTHVYNKWATQKQIDTRYSVNVTDYEMSVYE